MSFIRSISGVRATLGDDLTPSVIAEYVAAFAALSPEGAIAVGRDGRPSGAWIEQVVCGTLSACGRSVLQLGLVPTPTVQLFAEREGVAGGIAITASHNPAEWNGLKFLNSRGVFLDSAENMAMWEILDSQKFHFVSEQKGGEMIVEDNPLDQHIHTLVSLPVFSGNNGANLKKIRSGNLKIVVDAVNCSGSSAIPALLDELGCRVIPLYCDASGVFPHTPEPLTENLGDLRKAVLEHGADLGIAVDPDADRLVLIDECGEPVGEENTLVLAVQSVLSNRSAFTENSEIFVATNLSTTGAVDEIAWRFGAKTVRSAVGEINVVKAMQTYNALIGGEGSGGVILPACHSGRDSLVGTALVLLLLAQSEMTLSALTESLPKRSMVKLKKHYQGNPTELFDALQVRYQNTAATRIDGLKLDFIRSWVHLRASNTEPIVRIIAEAETHKEAEELAHSFMQFIP